MPPAHARLAAVAASAALALAPPLPAQTEAEPPAGADAPPDLPLLQRERLAGDLWGLRPALEQQALDVNAEYIAEYSSVWDGGLEQKASFRHLLTVDLTLDLETAFGIQGATLFAQCLSVNRERGGSLHAGDIQIYSNIESERSLDVLYELWWEQTLFNSRLRLKLGKVDANSEFAFIDVAGDFANSSAGFSPTIFVFPSYPDPATSVNAFLTLLDQEHLGLTLGYAFYDGAAGVDAVPTGSRGPETFFTDDDSDDYFHIAQADLAWSNPDAADTLLRDARLSLGGWWHTGDFERFDGDHEDGAGGLFLTAELRLFDPARMRPEQGAPRTARQILGRAGGDAPERGLYLFAQYAWADEDVSPFAQHIAGGVVWRGPDASRPDDSLGLYLSLADLSDEPAAGFEDDELVIDAYYRAQIAPAVFVQPEIQYIVNPSGDPDIDNALVGAVRVGIAF
jgi:porin